ncbi:MAG TPA: AAA family ATPase [Thermomicrobiaceae bacterium]|nr:AAA family ATPase [Thermomicrobiaceae bacterium]
MPAPSRHGAPTILVGRSRERDLTRAQLQAALAGHGGLVILGGEAGIGKTALAEETCREASAAGALVLVGRCYDGTETPPYGPWVELVAQARARPAGPAAPSFSGSPSQAALFDEVRDFLVALARARPLVILLEDLHWADGASLDLLRAVARRLASLPILLLATYRGDEVVRGHPLYRLLPLLVREALAVRLDLAPLGDDHVRALLDHDYRLPAADADRLTTYLQARAEGNPLFLGELLRSLEGTALLMAGDGGWSLGALEPVGVPLLLRQVIDARLARLGSEADSLLAVAATIGAVVPLALWAAVAGVTEEALDPLVERAVAARVLDAAPDGLAVRFSHALIRDALYESVLPVRRRRWHGRIAEALLEGRAPDPDSVAHHLVRAGDPRAATWLTRAGERAQRAFAWQTAAQRFEAALALLEGDQGARNERGWLLFHLALLRRFTDPFPAAAAMTEAERLGHASGDAALVAYARFFVGMLYRMSGDFRQGNTTTEEGVALLDALSPEDHARLASLATTVDPLDPQNGRGELTLVLGEAGRYAEARAIGERIVALPASETFGSRGDAYYGLGYTYAALGRPEAARDALARAREVFRAEDHRTQVLATLFDELVLVILPYQTDRQEERRRLEAELGDAFAAVDDLFARGSARTAGIVSLVLEGAWAEVLAIVDESRLRFLHLLSALFVAPVARHQGNAALAWSLVHQGLPAGPETAPADSAGFIVPLRALAPTLALDAGDLDAARRWLESLDRWLDWSGGVLGRADAHLGWAAYHRAAGDPPRARERASRALTAATLPRQPLTLLAAHRLLGELDIAAGRPDAAETDLAAALALADACGARHERALTLLALAELRRARGHVPAARAHLDEARALAAPMGATLTLARTDALAARLAGDVPVAPVTLPAGLTAREGEVLRLVAAGLTNAEIADRLSLSPRTVNAHLTTIYGKLGVTSRGAAIRFALDHHLR